MVLKLVNILDSFGHQWIFESLREVPCQIEYVMQVRDKIIVFTIIAFSYNAIWMHLHKLYSKNHSYTYNMQYTIHNTQVLKLLQQNE